MENNEFWKKPQSLDPRWEHRTKFICELIPNNITKILDIGAGEGFLKHYLPPPIEYIPLDIVARDNTYLEFNLNNHEFPLLKNIDLITALGVLEYIENPDWLIIKIKETTPNLLITYCCSHNNITNPSMNMRINNRWINHYNESEFEDLLKKFGTIIEKRLYKSSLSSNQFVYLVKQ